MSSIKTQNTSVTEHRGASDHPTITTRINSIDLSAFALSVVAVCQTTELIQEVDCFARPHNHTQYIPEPFRCRLQPVRCVLSEFKRKFKNNKQINELLLAPRIKS